MKIIKHLFTLTIVALMLVSCSKDEVEPTGTINISIAYKIYFDNRIDTVPDQNGFIYLFEHQGGEVDLEKSKPMNGEFYYKGSNQVHHAKKLNPTNGDGVVVLKNMKFAKYFVVARSSVRNSYSYKEFTLESVLHEEYKVFGQDHGFGNIKNEDWSEPEPEETDGE